MRAIVLTTPDVRRWALESLLRNGGFDVDFIEDPVRAGRACADGSVALVAVGEPDDGRELTLGLLSALPAEGRPAVVASTGRSPELAEALGDDAEWVRLLPVPVDGLILRMVIEELGLDWSGVPADRPPLDPPAPDRPWGIEGMKKGTVDAAGEPTSVDEA